MRRALRGWVLFGVGVGAAACASDPPAAVATPRSSIDARSSRATPGSIEPAPLPKAGGVPAGERSLAATHFDVTWTEPASSEEDAKRVLLRAADARAKLVTILGKERVGDRRIRIRLSGDGSPRELPTVDPASGDILLYRFAGAGGEYEAPLAHELVHAIRRTIWTNPDRQTDPGLFWEEGFAELIAREAGFASTGFPLYGFDPHVGAASFVTRGESIPLGRLITEHKALNFRCMAQAYVERISFMLAVRDRVGLAPMITAAYVDGPLDVPTLEKSLGAKLTDLTAAHEKLVASSAALEPARKEGTKFRETTAIRYLPLCPATGPVKAP